ncbi:MAG: hypothetical protein IT340_19850 [Chloroflexi bacterium]|nr:hypothetical protein [Chloroflexota bacterium]
MPATFAPTASYYLIVPTNLNDGTPVDASYIRDIAAGLADKFGGATIDAGGAGYWWSDTAGLVKDGVARVWSLADDTPANDAVVLTLASRIAHDLGQEAVLAGKRPEYAAFVAAAAPVAAAAD